MATDILLCMFHFIVSAHGLLFQMTTMSRAEPCVGIGTREQSSLAPEALMRLSSHDSPPTNSSTCMSSAVARAMRVHKRGFMGVPGRDSPFSNFW